MNVVVLRLYGGGLFFTNPRNFMENEGLYTIIFCELSYRVLPKYRVWHRYLGKTHL